MTLPRDGTRERVHAPHRRGAVRHLRAHIARLPLLARAGLAVFMAGVVIDVLFLVLGSGHASHHAAAGHSGHLVAMAGMTAILAGVVIDGARLQLHPRGAKTQPEEQSDAIR
jgi:predicted phage tail protein